MIKKILHSMLAGVALLLCAFAGCVSENHGNSLDDPFSFSVGLRSSGAAPAVATQGRNFYVQQGVPFTYQVESQGARVRITVRHWSNGSGPILDQKEGVSFTSTFSTNYTGLAFYTIEAIDDGIATGVVTPITKIPKK